jgi:hypothetical protein
MIDSQRESSVGVGRMVGKEISGIEELEWGGEWVLNSSKRMEARWRFRVRRLTARTARWLVERWMKRRKRRAVQVWKGVVRKGMRAVPVSMPRREMIVSWEESFCVLF